MAVSGKVTVPSNYSRKQLTGLVLGLVLFIGILLWPSIPGLSVQAQRMLAVALLMATWWISEAIAIPATALLPLFLFPTLGILKMPHTAANYAHQLVFLFLGGFLIAAAMVKWRLHKRIALLTIRLFGSGPYRIVLGFMVATAFLSMWISNTATAMMMLPIGMAVVERMSTYASLKMEIDGDADVPQLARRNLGLALMLGIAYSASIGGIGTLIGTPPNGVLVGMIDNLFRGTAPAISFSQWMMLAMPLVLVMLPIAWLLVTKVAPSIPLDNFSFGGGSREVIDNELKKLGPMSPGEQKTAIVFALTALMWLTRKPINFGLFETPGWSGLMPEPTFITDATVAMIMGLILFFLPADFHKISFKLPRRDIYVMDWQTARNSIPFGVLFLFGGGFALANGFAISGLSSAIGSSLQFLGGFPVVIIIATICFLMTFLTEMTSNTATTTLILPMLAVAAIDLGQHPFLLMIPAAISASCAFMLPVATPPNAIVFGSRWVTIPKMTKAGIWLNLIGIIAITTLTLTVATYLLGIPFNSVPDWGTTLR